MKRALLALLAWLLATALLAPICFFAVIFLAGPHGGFLPAALAPAVMISALVVLLGAPLLAARVAWRRWPG